MHNHGIDEKFYFNFPISIFPYSDSHTNPYYRTNKFQEIPDPRMQRKPQDFRQSPSPLDALYFESYKPSGDIRANAKTYGDFRERPPFFGPAESFPPRPRSLEKTQGFAPPNPMQINAPINYPNELFLKPIYPKLFLENYLSISKNLTNKAPPDYKYVLAKNIQNLGGIEDTIASSSN